MNVVSRPQQLTDSNHKQRMAALHEKTDKLHLFEFWGENSENEHEATEKLRADRTPAIPHLWRYKDIHPCLLEAAELIPMELSERRSIIMVNPALRPYVATTTNLFAAYRINTPHEMMPPHRHSPNAIRFGLTGATNFTGVHGENITFGPGDLVLTPHDTWHNHGNGPDQASVNLSVLDMPLVNALNATYFEFDYKEIVDGKLIEKKVQSASVPDDYSQRYYGIGGLTPRFINHSRGAGTSSPMFVYRWEQTEKMLRQVRDHDGSPYEGILIEYTNPTTGQPVYKTMTFFIQMLRPGEKLLPVRQNSSLICTAFQGKGQSIIGGKTFDWEPFDTFCIPGGQWYEHVNTSTTDDAIMLISSDEPTLRKLGFALKHGRNRNGDAVVLESSNSVGRLMQGSDLELQAADGVPFQVYIVGEVLPSRPAIIMFPPIFGADNDAKAIADRWADRGYLVAVPDYFFRTVPGVLDRSDGGRKAAMERWKSLNVDRVMTDMIVLKDYLLSRKTCNGKLAALGFCAGGELAFLASTRLGANAVATFHATHVDRHLDEAHKAAGRITLHYGSSDSLVPMDQVEVIRKQVAADPRIDVHVYEGASHGFSFPNQPSYHETAAIQSDHHAQQAFSVLKD